MPQRASLHRLAAKVHPRELVRKVRRLWSIPSLARLAPPPREIGWYPGWFFGIGERNHDAPAQERLRLWKDYAETGREESFTVPWYEGLRLWIHVPSDGSWAWLIDRCYEPNQFALLQSTLRPGMLVVDVGANDGYYSLYASRRVGERGRVLALEPSAREYARLVDNLRLNTITNVEAVKTAASRSHGTARLRVAEARHAGHNTFGSFIYETALLREEEVPMIPLDALAAAKGIARVDVLKIDVEGAEQAVLEGAHGIIGRDHPLIILEVVDKTLRRQDSSQEALLGLLRGWGYRLHAFDPSSGLPVSADAPIGREENMVAVHPHGLGLPASESASGPLGAARVV